MKYKKLMLVTLLLLAILTIGAVSAVEDTNGTITADNSGELSWDLDDEIASIEKTDMQTKEIDDGKLTADTKDNSIEAGEPKWTVSFNATGGEGVMTNVFVENNTDYTLPECVFTKEYRVFYGWNVGEEIKQPGENITVTDNIIIKTVWKFDVEFEPGKAKVFDLTYDDSTTSITGILILTDTCTGDVVVKNITVGPVQSSLTNATANDGANLTDFVINQLLSIAQIPAGSKEVTVKNQTVSNFTVTERFDNRTWEWFYSNYEGDDGLIPSSMK